jgi:hypothetical protein
MNHVQSEWRVLSDVTDIAVAQALFPKLILLGASQVRVAAVPTGAPEHEAVRFTYWVRWQKGRPAPEAVYAETVGEDAPFRTLPVSARDAAAADSWRPFGPSPFGDLLGPIR